MADLAVEFAGIRFKNPILIGSASLGNNIKKMERLERAGAGGIVTKLISNAPMPPAHVDPLRTFIPGDSWCCVGDERLTLEQGVDLIKEAKKIIDIPIIANVGSIGTDEDKWVQIGLALEQAGVDMLEVGMSCPLGITDDNGVFKPLVRDRGYHRVGLGEDPVQAGKVMKTLKQAVKIPVMPKLSPKPNYAETAISCQENGIDAFCAGFVQLALAGVDIHNTGKSVYPFLEKGGIGVYQGTFVHPIANMHLAILAKLLNVPLSTSGGITTWEHIVERIMLGATTVQLCSAIYLKGLQVIEECLQGLEAYLEKYQYNSLEDFKGCALSDFSNFGETVVTPCVAKIVDEEKCRNCKDICWYKVDADCLAMSLNENGIPQIEQEKCNGCCLCYWACNENAISMEVA